MAQIKKLKNNGTTIYPVTIPKSIVCKNGTTLGDSIVIAGNDDFDLNEIVNIISTPEQTGSVLFLNSEFLTTLKPNFASSDITSGIMYFEMQHSKYVVTFYPFGCLSYPMYAKISSLGDIKTNLTNTVFQRYGTINKAIKVFGYHYKIFFDTALEQLKPTGPGGTDYGTLKISPIIYNILGCSDTDFTYRLSNCSVNAVAYDPNGDYENIFLTQIAYGLYAYTDTMSKPSSYNVLSANHSKCIGECDITFRTTPQSLNYDNILNETDFS